MQEAPAIPQFEKPFDIKSMEGITAPLGFWDPAGFSTGASEGRVRFYREVEIKHGRLAMLASLGYLVAEQFHPLFGGQIDVPSFVAFQATPLQTFWPAVLFITSSFEVFSVFTFESPLLSSGEVWSMRKGHYPGDFGFDPLGLSRPTGFGPTGEAELKEMQNRELNNGRLAMIGIAGMVAQEAVSGGKLF